MAAALRRRTLLAGAAGSVAATSGCIGELRNLVGREETRQLSLSIATVPASADPYAVRVANELAANLRQAGIDTTVGLMSPDVLLRTVLVNHDFDMYVARYPSEADPDETRTLLHSSYGEEAGWQNPFGFSDLGMDDLLDAQRRQSGQERMDTVHRIQREIVRQQPFTVVAFPDRVAAVRTDRFRGWPPGGLVDPLEYLQLERVDETDTIRLLLTDPRITRNRNPIAAEYRDQGNVIGLLYEPLVRSHPDGSGRIPWLAREVEWDESDRLDVTVQLRETPWHDGERLTASDVAFTYRFLQDTSLGAFDSPLPTPWRRGRVSLVDEVTVQSEDACRITFTAPAREVARRALQVPILPEHVWRERTEVADVAGIEIADQTTEALVVSNDRAVGSGPLQFVEAVPDQYLRLEAFEEHFLYGGNDDGIPSPYSGGLPFERARFDVAPSHSAAVEVLENDGADASIDGLQASVVPRIGRNEDLSLSVRRSNTFYHVGYNCRDAPLSNPHFRRAVARLVDRDNVVSQSFGGYAQASQVPLQAPWSPETLRWNGTAALPFAGSDGELDVPVARDAFRDAGYQYENGQLVRRGAR